MNRLSYLKNLTMAESGACGGRKAGKEERNEERKKGGNEERKDG